MLRSRRIVSSLVVAALVLNGVLVAPPVRAESPLSRLSLFKKLEADPNKEYPLTENHGPWLILCSTFLGEDAEAQAKELVLELRSEFKLAAYVHKQKWDFSTPVGGRGFDKHGEPKKMKYRNYQDRQEFAVLVGDFPTGDDPEGKKILDKIRYAHPRCLDPNYIAAKQQENARALSGWRAALSSNTSEANRRGPMAKAFMVTNPMFPDDYFKPKGLDPLVEKMNEGVEFGLLKANGRYTVKVATFQGSSLSMPKEVAAVEKGQKSLNSRLEAAALQAHLLTIALREKGYEAYEFHDHASSIVTVGSFASYGTPRQDGKIEIDPAMHKTMQDFSPTRQTTVGGRTEFKPRSLVGIPFDVQPQPVEIPQRTVSTAFNRSR